MQDTKSIDSQYLLELGYNIQKLPSDEASTLLLEANTILLLAGFPEIAYQGFLKLIQGELKISEFSALANPIKTIIPVLCYHIKMDCPSIFSEQEISFSELEQYINKNLKSYDCKVFEICGCFFAAIASRNWSEQFFYDITHPQDDVKGDKRKIYTFLEDLHLVISQSYVNRRKWQKATKLLKVFEDVIDAWEIDHLTWMEREIMVLGIRIYLNLEDTDNAERFIQRWWQSSKTLMECLFVVAYKPDILKKISAGVLRSKMNISQEQAQEFLDLVNARNYIPPKMGFIPTVDDWQHFLAKWNQAIFDNLEEEHMENYKFLYSDVINSNSCLRIGTNEEEITGLETELKTKLPLSYRNFLLASNGFTILDEYCILYGTEEIKWFIEENRDWAEIWDDDVVVEDEEYFQYGEHQCRGSMRGRYMKTALQISSTEDGYVYLLNPQIIDSRNEWEAWYFGDKHLGAYRYRSFWEMMQETYKRSSSS